MVKSDDRLVSTRSRWSPYEVFLASCKSFLYLSVRLDVARLTAKWDFLTELSLNVYLCSLHSYSRTPHRVYYLTEQSIVSTITVKSQPNRTIFLEKGTQQNIISVHFTTQSIFKRHIDSTLGEKKILGFKPCLESLMLWKVIWLANYSLIIVKEGENNLQTHQIFISFSLFRLRIAVTVWNVIYIL